MVCFIDGVAVDRVVGFSDLGNTDDFPTLALSRRFIKSGMIKAITKEEQGRVNISKGKKRNTGEDEDSGNDDY